MPLYDFHCANGHDFERITRDSVVECSCGSQAQRKEVSRFAPMKTAGWVSDFRFTPTMRAAHDEAMGYKKEAESIVREYTANGFRIPQDR